ncbi:uncharacterized protein Dyak_GE16183 [Drosophila yakuba]|uniref:Glycosyltransferase family 92 protein n=1 Tax=Drosophila yakuba TaxID=7245 RepID=B4Q200_DROYA|nr:uncharacterized protein Dyak_GE16183 [Drosophila yakuba]
MVYHQVRAFRTPLLCLLAFIVLYLLHQFMAKLQGLHEAQGTPLPKNGKCFVLHHGERDSKRWESSGSQQEAHQANLEDLLRGKEEEHWMGQPTADQCAPYPRYEDIEFPNPHFQLTRHGNLSYYLYGAHYDRRPRIPEMVILGMVTTCGGPYPPAYLQMWYDGETHAETVPVYQSKFGWYKEWGNLEGVAYPTVLTFQLKTQRVPQLVSLVFDPCAVPSNAFQVTPPPSEEPPKPQRPKRIGVCVKYLNFPDIDMSDRFVEWLELMRLLGASKVTAFDIGHLMANTRRTLDHYMRPEDGFLELRPFRFPNEIDEHVDFRKMVSEVLLYTDCLYRSLYDFDFVAVVDVDEVIMPLGEHHSWQDLLGYLQSRDVNSTARSSYCFRNVYYSQHLSVEESIPEQFFMLRHVNRQAEHSDPNYSVKCLHDTSYITVMHNHFPLQWMDAERPYDVSTDLGQMQHYRDTENLNLKMDPPPVRDDNIQRFQHQLIHNARKVHRQLAQSRAAY